MESWLSWLKALAWNAGIWATVSRVRIPHSPPFENPTKEKDPLQLQSHPEACRGILRISFPGTCEWYWLHAQILTGKLDCDWIRA